MQPLKSVCFGCIGVAILLFLIAAALISEAKARLLYGPDHECGDGIGREEDYV